jgi:hypothetical protein
MLVVNVGIHLQWMCTRDGVNAYVKEEESKKGKACCLPFREQSPECYDHHFGLVEGLLERIHAGRLVKRIIWRVTYPQRLAWSSSVVNEGRNTTEPFAGRSAVDESQLGAWDNRGWVPGFHEAEMKSMTSQRMKDIGVEVLDVAEMIIRRTDSHTEEANDRNTKVHHCIPGPLDDVNSLLLNAMCG